MKTEKELIHEIVTHKLFPAARPEWYPINVQTSLAKRFSIKISLDSIKDHLEQLVWEEKLEALHDRPGTTYRLRES
jgi:hypothetical protein